MLHEAVITIKKVWPLYKPGAKRITIEDAGGTSYRVDVAYFDTVGVHEGDTVAIGYTDEVTAPEYGGKPYKLIKKISERRNAAQSGPPLSPPLKANDPILPSDIGPHVGMWEKEAFNALVNGMSSSEVIIRGIEARRAAREIVRTDLDGKLSDDERSTLDHDNLGDTF